MSTLVPSVHSPDSPQLSQSDDIIVDGELHSPSRRPSPSSRLVQRAHSQLLIHLDLPSLVAALHTLSVSLSSAHRGLASFPVLQARLSTASINATRLADHTASTVESFTIQADNVLQNLESIYALLRQGMEPVATQVLKDATTSGAHLASQARLLAQQFENAAKDVSQMLEQAHDKQHAQMEKRIHLESQVQNMSILLQKAQLSTHHADHAIKEADQMCKLAASKEWWANFKCNALHVGQVLALAGSILHSRVHLLTLSSVTALAGTLDNERMNAREETIVHLHRKQKCRLQKLDLRKEMAELSSRLEAIQAQEVMCQSTITALQNTVTTLRQLSASMMQAESFWNQLHSHCGRLSATGLLSFVESSKSLEKHERNALWTSHAFKHRAISFYARWAALHAMCDRNGILIRQAHQTFYRLIDPDQIHS